MKLLISIDDTDNLESQGTGELAEAIALIIAKNAWGVRSRVSRHQLLVHPDIPYTSHNSSMCFAAELLDEYYPQMLKTVQAYLENYSAAGSDPGLCIVNIEKLVNARKLVEYGNRAKREILDKDSAYSLAAELGIHLSEHGGTGDGIIGALAGAGLRLSGNDGRFRGKLQVGDQGECVSAGYIMDKAGLDGVSDVGGYCLEADEAVFLGDFVKAVLLQGKCVLLVEELEEPVSNCRWKTAGKQRLKRY